MSPQKQRIAIAIACGWTNVKPVVVQSVKHQGDDRTVGISSDSGWIPDYLNDLNACHEMEQVLTHDQRIDYMEWLGLSSDEHWYKVWAYVHATAAERCTAFIRTLGLWEKEANEPRTEEADVATVIPDPLADMRARAEAGDRHAQCTLGDAYAHGMEVAKDRVESDRWYAMFSAPFPLTTPEPELNSATEESSATDHFRDATKMVSGESLAPTPTQPQ